MCVSVSVTLAGAIVGEAAAGGLADARGTASDGVAVAGGSGEEDGVAAGRAPESRRADFFLTVTVNGAVARCTSQPCACINRKRLA